MIRNLIRSLSLTLTVLTLLTVFHQTALAGPPLLCHPIEIGNARSLPWDGPYWRSVKADYDINRLVEDTMVLLTPQTPVLVRMETLRRATIYSVWAMKDSEVGYTVKNTKIANELLSRLKERAHNAKGKGRAEALALFDFGYLVESYKQASHASDGSNLANNIDGYASITKAISMYGYAPEMEFAAALVTLGPQRTIHREHLQKALNGAPAGSLLARNLVSHFGNMGKTIAELRQNLRVAKN